MQCALPGKIGTLLLLLISGILGCADDAHVVNGTSQTRDQEALSTTTIIIAPGRTEVSIRPGTQILWVNMDKKNHSVTSPIGLWDSGRIKPGEVFTRTFEEEGEFEFVSVYDREVTGKINSSRGANRNASSVDPSVMTAMDMGQPLEKFKPGLLPEWQTVAAVEQGFRMIRDDKIIRNGAGFRRIPWDFIEDACSPRAAIASEALEKAGFRRPARLFAFGPLSVSKDDQVANWWYHLAPVVAAEGQIFVLDPTVNPDRAQTIQEWLSRITVTPEEITLSLCNPFAYTPWSMCYISGPEEEAGAEEELLLYESGRFHLSASMSS
ncbi:MAG TPA: protein-glutamine glutaminase family protein [Bdellovibrionota bacterium]|nr:protein-glutamine glutaminase family protein [Bdellovibrionota bacterium]